MIWWLVAAAWAAEVRVAVDLDGLPSFEQALPVEIGSTARQKTTHEPVEIETVAQFTEGAEHGHKVQLRVTRIQDGQREELGVLVVLAAKGDLGRGWMPVAGGRIRAELRP